MTPVARLTDLPETGARAYTAEGHDVLIVRSQAGLFAIENMCSHAYSRLEEGKVKGVHIFCPLHGARFDLRDGSPSGKLTDRPIKAWHVEVADGLVQVDFGRRLDRGG